MVAGVAGSTRRDRGSTPRRPARRRSRPGRSTTRNASCTMSPCSACRRQIKRPSAESPPAPAGSSRPTPMGAGCARMSLGGPAGGDEVRTVVLLRAEPERDLARARERDPLSPARGETFDQGPSLGPVERGGHPSPGLVPDVVLPPHDPSIRRDQCFFHPDRLVRDPASSAGAQVRGPDLPRAILVRYEGEKVWGAVDPGREADLGRGESPLPGGGVNHGTDDVTGAVRLVSRDTLDLESLALGVAEC